MEPPHAGKHFPLGNPGMRTLVGVATTAVVAMLLFPALGIGLALLAGRTIDAWRSALVGLVERGGDYREASLTLDDLARVLEDPSAPAEQRIGAALGLRSLRGSEGAEAALTRIRIAAAATANPRVRIALTKAAEDELDDAAVDEACMEEASSSEGASA